MLKASKPAASQWTARPITIIEAPDRSRPKSRASSRRINSLGNGRCAVRFILASISASHHWLSAPAPPAASAIHKMAVKPMTGWMLPGAASRPHSAVNTTRRMTLGLVSAKKSRQSAIMPDTGEEVIGAATGLTAMAVSSTSLAFGAVMAVIILSLYEGALPFPARPSLVRVSGERRAVRRSPASR